MSFFKKNCVWFFLVPAVTALLAYGPYIALNIIHRTPWTFWRIPFVPVVLYDSDTYYAWIGAALSGLQYGDHLSAFDPVIRAIGYILPRSVSVAEVWLLTLWITVTIFVWVAARAIGEWSGLDKTASRWFSVLLACSLVLPHLPRPGVYTWYVPFYAFGLFGVGRIQDALRRAKLLPAVLWSVASILATSVYPYNVIHIALWVGILWFLYLHERFRRVIRVAMIIGTLVVVPMITMLMPWLVQPKFRLALELKFRIGLAFTQLPLLSNSLLLVICWTIFIVFFAIFFQHQSSIDRRLFNLSIGWIVLSMAWLSNIFTGVYIQNDHFRAPAVILAWLSLAVVWKVMSEAYASEHMGAAGPPKSSHWIVISSALTFLIALFMVIEYGFVKSYVFRGDYLNVVHFSHWLTLAAASFLVLRFFYRRTMMSAGSIWAFMIIVVLFGFSARAFLFNAEKSTFRSYMSYVQTITWIRS
ncbi:MAG: hypothetical protein WC895_04835, partial [Candidatus Shapirobacteria bacterium]